MSKNSREKISNIVKYTVEKNIRNKWFVILNVILFLVTLVSLNFNTIKTFFEDKDIQITDKKFSIEIVDNYNLIKDNLIEEFKLQKSDKNVEFKIKETVEYEKDTLEENRAILEVLPSDDNMLNIKIISKDGIDSKYINVIQKVANEKKNELYANKYDIDIESIEKINQEVSIERIMVGVDSNNSDIKTILQTLLNYFILLILMIVLSKIANDVSQEKVSKSIEYVLTTISAKAYLIAKVISINLTLIAQLVLGIVYFLISSFINSLLSTFIITPNNDININIDMTEINFSLDTLLSSIDLSVIFYILVIFVFIILTVLILCVIQAALSARTTNISEASNATILLVLINLVIYLVSTLVISPIKETSMILYILSCLPIVSMYFIPSMMLIGQVNIIQIAVAFVLLIVSIPFVLKYSAKFFKEGILDNNTKKKTKEVIKEKSVRELQEEYILKRDFSRYGFVIGISVLLFIVLQVVLSLAITPIVAVLGTTVSLSVSNINTISNIIVFIISLLIPTFFVMVYIPKVSKKEKLEDDVKNDVEQSKNIIKKITVGLKSILVVVPIVMVVQILLSLLLEKLGLNYDIIDKVNLYDSSSLFSKILFFVQIAVLPAIFEELYIRKAVLNYSKKYGTVFAIISSSILFSLIHLNISQALFAFIMGIILAVVTIRNKSIIPAAIIHFINNGYAAIITIFENNLLVLSVTNIIMLLLCVIGVVIAIYEIIKNRKVIKDVIVYYINIFKKKEIKDDLDEINLNNNSDEIFIQTKLSKGYKYILYDYTFIISTILVFVMLFVTQSMLSLL